MAQMIEVVALDNGVHRNQTYNGKLPDGWAIIPDDMEIPETFPFVDVTAENGVVVSMTAGVVPEPEPSPEPDPEPETETSIYDELAAAYMEGVNSIDE